MSEHDGSAIVIDAGSGTCKVGFGGMDAPAAMFPSVVGRPEGRSAADDVFVGEEALTERATLTLANPIDRGTVTDWADMEALWCHAFHGVLCVDPEARPVFLSDAPLQPEGSREKMAQLMFESFNVPALYVAYQAALTIYAGGETTGLVLTSGHGVTHAVPVFDGYSLPNTVVRLHLGGRDLSDYMAALLLAGGGGGGDRSFSTAAGRDAVRGIKEQRCYVALDFERETASPRPPSRDSYYALPDGGTVYVRDERFRCPEALFRPALLDMQCPGIHEAIHSAVMGCDAEARKDLLGNVVLSGGNTMFPGTAARLKKELRALAPAGLPVTVNAPPERMHSVWIGASILSSLSTAEEMWVTKADYHEKGPSVMNLRCFE